MLRILYDDLNQKVKNIHDEMDLHHSYKKKAFTPKGSVSGTVCVYQKYSETSAQCFFPGKKIILFLHTLWNFY